MRETERAGDMAPACLCAWKIMWVFQPQHSSKLVFKISLARSVRIRRIRFLMLIVLLVLFLCFCCCCCCSSFSSFFCWCCCCHCCCCCYLVSRLKVALWFRTLSQHSCFACIVRWPVEDTLHGTLVNGWLRVLGYVFSGWKEPIEHEL